MESFLNFIWAALAATMAVFWTRLRPLRGVRSRVQLTALAVSVLILLPVVSISDDLLAAQVPAEGNTSLRWKAKSTTHHVIAAHLAVLPHRPFAGFFPTSQTMMSAGVFPLISILPPVSAPVQNRPPPIL